MEEKKELFVREVRPGVFLMDEAHEATGYLVVGRDKACVIDTMNGYNDLYKRYISIRHLFLCVGDTPEETYPQLSGPRQKRNF